MEKEFSFTGRIRSFKYAGQGIITMIKSQHNAWIHSLATILAIVSGVVFNITKSDWCFIILAIVVVWMAEALNTAFEFLADVASPEFHPLVKNAKDVAAGAVLISAIGSVAVGIIIVGPYFIKLLG
ncbi:MAG: diacylglycerol kinase family protein [Bacteroidota bacterium]